MILVLVSDCHMYRDTVNKIHAIQADQTILKSVAKIKLLEELSGTGSACGGKGIVDILIYFEPYISPNLLSSPSSLFFT